MGPQTRSREETQAARPPKIAASLPPFQPNPLKTTAPFCGEHLRKNLNHHEGKSGQDRRVRRPYNAAPCSVVPRCASGSRGWRKITLWLVLLAGNSRRDYGGYGAHNQGNCCHTATHAHTTQITPLTRHSNTAFSPTKLLSPCISVHQ
ncbi:hypothetical protein Bbelb_125050 [Branchiostoma belcheri]|nr:hypothetical protein Bbelb_125050 [Branchiostoma belcheri]